MDTERLAALAAALAVFVGIVAPAQMLFVTLGILMIGLLARRHASHARSPAARQNRR